MYEVTTSNAVIKNPGTKPARKSLGIDCSAIKPYIINRLLGGIMLPKAPPAADTAPANLLVYPSRFITGIVIGTMSGGVLQLDNKKYKLKRDVKGVQIGDYTNVILPKGTIIYNVPGGVFAHQDVLAAYQSGQNKYFNKPTLKGISIKNKAKTVVIPTPTNKGTPPITRTIKVIIIKLISLILSKKT